MMFLQALATVFFLGCSGNVIPQSRDIKLAQATNDLALQLMNISVNEKNVFISPLSISTALAMIYRGADGTSSQVMRRVLHYDQYGHSETDLHEAFHSLLTRLQQNTHDYHFSAYNGLLIQEGFRVRSSYEADLRNHYSAQIETANFATNGEQVKAKINADVENATRGKITDFLSEAPNVDTKLFLLSAVYFLGSWKTPFNLDHTYERIFYNNGAEEKTVQMMRRDGVFYYSFGDDLGASILVLPYRGNHTASMIILLPNERTGVAQLQRTLTRESLERALGRLRHGRIIISVPKFRLSYDVDLKQTLSTLGLEELFDEADFSRLLEDQVRLRIRRFLHKTVVDVDEKGTEAAGVTGVEAIAVSLPPMITVDHPFLFFIREDQNGCILFSGRVDEL